MYLLSRHVRVYRSGVHSIDTCAVPKVPRPGAGCIHWRPCILSSPDKPKNRPAARRDTFRTCIVENAPVERGETEEDDRAGGKSNARVVEVDWASGSVITHFFHDLKEYLRARCTPQVHHFLSEKRKCQQLAHVVQHTTHGTPIYDRTNNNTNYCNDTMGKKYTTLPMSKPPTAQHEIGS